MPLINGIKMACEPCIRGHRSTKCTHANERLMVPVKKPGRPLSACPHIHNQLCGCSSVTAAILRKQKCHCGTSTGTTSAVQSKPVASATLDTPSSPTKDSFRVQKPASSSKTTPRKHSYDLSNFDRIDTSHVNVVPFQSLLGQSVHSPIMQNGSNTSSTQILYKQDFLGSELSDIMMQSSYTNHSDQLNGADIGSSIISDNSIEPKESYLHFELIDKNIADSNSPLGRASCCAPKSDISSKLVANETLSPMGRESKDTCCSSKEILALANHESQIFEATPDTPLTDGSSGVYQYAFPSNFNIDQTLYSSFTPQTTVFAYPPSYGSYQHPLQPAEWRRSVMSNMYAQPSHQPQISNPPSSFASSPDALLNLDTFHTCSCGDTCQCIGCAAHPYNDATQDYVRSAYKMIHDMSALTAAEIASDRTKVNDDTFSSMTDHKTVPSSSDETANSNGEDFSPALTGSSSDGTTVEEQTLPASDYFFVNYPFTSEGCGGDTNTCPCGDDCECIGCTIHRFDEPMIPLPIPSPMNGDFNTNDHTGALANGKRIKHEDFQEEIEANVVKSCCN